ncbi:MAG: DUF6502 family protein [Candidatus Binatia bacterium]
MSQRKDSVEEELVRATVETARPFAKRLLAFGVPFGRVERRLREMFVEVAESESTVPGKASTDSRISLLTGINRKEVHRLRSAGHKEAPRSFSMNRAVNLISRWLSSRETTDHAGHPLPIPYQAERGPSFVGLARQVTGDLAPRVFLDVLVRSGAVEVRERNMVALVSESYVPGVDRAEGLQILAEDPPELVDTILRNVFSEESDRLLQRKIFYDNLGADALNRIRAEIRREGERFLRRVDRVLSRYDRDRNPDAPGGGRIYAAVGAYFFDRPEGSGGDLPGATIARRKNRKG